MGIWGKIGWMLLGFFVVLGILIAIGAFRGTLKMGKRSGDKKKEEESGDPTDTPLSTPTVPDYLSNPQNKA